MKLLLVFLLSFPAFADERIASEAQLRKEGFLPAPALKATRYETYKAMRAIVPHSLQWPIPFASASETMGNVMAQFQPFSNPPYWHGGIDIRTLTSLELRTPVAGQLEAGHYSYTTKPDGSMVKFFKPWPAHGPSTYFEVAVVTDDGMRFEYHHVDRSRLPAPIVALLNAGGGRVEAGTALGRAVLFSSSYTHIHYNIILPDGIRVNPEYLSRIIPDDQAPKILAAGAILRTGKVLPLDQPLPEMPVEFVVATVDKLSAGPYEHPPAGARVIFENKKETRWDFRMKLEDRFGNFPVLSEFFKDKVTMPDGRTYETEGGYGTGTSVIRLKTPAGAAGRFSIDLVDQAGNVSSIQGAVAGRTRRPGQR